MDELEISSPLYLAISSESCWKCSNLQKVIAIAASGIKSEFETLGNDTKKYFVTNIEEMPNEIYDYIVALHPNYKKHYSHNADLTYYANTCTCNANFGDFYLFTEPDGAFFPQSDELAAAIKTQLLPFDGHFKFIASYGSVPENIKFSV
jgi:hypothetical protein